MLKTWTAVVRLLCELRQAYAGGHVGVQQIISPLSCTTLTSVEPTLQWDFAGFNQWTGIGVCCTDILALIFLASGRGHICRILWRTGVPLVITAVPSCVLLIPSRKEMGCNNCSVFAGPMFQSAYQRIALWHRLILGCQTNP